MKLGKPRDVPWPYFLVAVAMAVGFAILWQKAEAEKRAAQAQERRRAEVAATATEFLTDLTNFSAPSISEDVEEIRSYAIGDFADQVDEFFGETAVAAIKRAQASSTGKVESVFVESLDEDSASVFGVVNESVTNSGTPTPKTAVLRIEIDMIETADGWKVSNVNLLESPTGPGLGA